MNINGKYVTLRSIEKTDLELMKNMLNDAYIEDKVIGWSFPVSTFQQEKWYEENISNLNNLRFIIDTPDYGPVGLVTLINIDWKNRCADHGIKLANADFRGKNIGRDAVMAIMRYAFDELQMHRLDSCRFEDNVASERLYTKCGWKVEGCKRQCIYKKGSYRDLILTGILASEYYELIEEDKYWD